MLQQDVWRELNVDRLSQQESVCCSVFAEFGGAVWLDQTCPEHATERWRIHQAKVNLIPWGMINFKFEHSYLCTLPLSLSMMVFSREWTFSEAAEWLSGYRDHALNGGLGFKTQQVSKQPSCWSVLEQDTETLPGPELLFCSWPLTSLRREQAEAKGLLFREEWTLLLVGWVDEIKYDSLWVGGNILSRFYFKKCFLMMRAVTTSGSGWGS